MDDLPIDQTAGGIIFSLLLVLVVFWIAKKAGFFRLPPPSSIVPVSFLQTLGAFLTYLIFAFLVLPILLVLFAFLATGEVESLKKLPQAWLGWIQLASLCTIFVLIALYCLIIKWQTRRFIFWGEKEVSFSRFWKGLGMGVVGWAVSYPFVLVVSIFGKYLSKWIWGEFQAEQVAVKQLKLTMGNPILLTLMVFAVVVLVPFVEEVLFRGFLQNFFKRSFGRTWAIILSAILFSFAHFSISQGASNFQLILSLLVLSGFLGFIYERERTLWASIGLHMAFNAFNVMFILL